MSKDTPLIFVGYHDPDRKRPLPDKLAAALALHARKTGHVADLCLCNIEDAMALGVTAGVRIEGRSYISRNVFYVGRALVGAVPR